MAQNIQLFGPRGNSSIHHVKQITDKYYDEAKMIDRNVLRPTPGKQHHWNTGAEENQQLNPGGPSNRQKSSGPNQLK